MQEGNDLLQQFNFIPHARLDDLMVSYAPDGGGVGPHFDSYDVFLLQGCGQRLWRMSEQKDLSLVAGAPLRILQNFHSEQEWTLSAGDMLYLPPHVAHWGIAIGDCMTYSIGFRAPSAEELSGEFLNYLQMRRELSGRYSDPDLTVQSHPAEISAGMIKKVDSILDGLKWNEEDVARFLGQYLSEPKSHVVFEPPPSMSLKTFCKRIALDGIKLGYKSQLLKAQDSFYLNGEVLEVDPDSVDLMMKLADDRQLTSDELSEAVKIHENLVAQLYDWYLAGWLIF
jgi:50S ribosomal protein L16 3-hydroxylase